MFQFITQLFTPVISTSCVMAVLAYGLVRTRFLALILSNKELDLRNRLSLILPFMLFSAYGALNAIPVAGSYVALDHVGQIVGGLLAGPIVGIGAGTVLTVFRYSFGDYLALPAALTCMLAGLFAGLYHEWYREWNRSNKLDAKRAVVFTLIVEFFGMVLSLLLLPDFHKAWEMVAAGALPTLIGNACAVGLFIFILNALIEEKTTVAIKERIESELSFARDIQLSLVPKTFPAFPEVKELDIYGILEPAKEVGGDLYDFFFIDENHFCFLVGDVSGKGVPAALFMSATRSLLKAQAEPGMEPDELLYKVNNEICRGNDASMFVTLFCGIMDIRTGIVVYCSAGHNPPYIFSHDGQIAQVTKTIGMPLGTMEDMPYSHKTLTMNTGDMMVIYTDGVTEAMNPYNEMFCESRLEQTLLQEASHSSRTVVENMLQAVRHFAGEADQSDDITIMAVLYRKCD